MKLYRPFHFLAFRTLLVSSCLFSNDIRAQSLQVQFGPAEPVPRALYTFNSNLLTATAFHGITYDGPELQNAVRNLRPFGLRFPGGTIANNYLWRRDSFSEQKDDKTGWAGEQMRLFRQVGRPYGLPEFIRMCKRYDLQPIWVLNVYEETPSEAVALMDHLAKAGLKVRAVELANEPYWDPRSLINVWDYIRYCQPIAAALKQHYPEIKLGACFGPLHPGPTDYKRNWNSVLAKQAWYDAVVYHEYYGGQGFALEEGTGLPVNALLHPEGFLDGPVKGLTEAAPGKPIWFTEWNIGSKGLEQWKDKGAELLFLGAVFVRLLEHHDAIHLACFHQIYGGSFGTTSYDTDTGQMQTSASWHFFRVLGAAFADASCYRAVNFATADVRGFATESADGVRLFVINRGAEPCSLILPEGLAKGAMRWTIHCPPEQVLPSSKTLLEPSNVAGREASLPAFSISLFGGGLQLPADLSVIDDTNNLFPRRPHLTFWHPPYSRQEPRFDVDGVYRVDLGAVGDTSVAVVTVNLSALRLKSGGRYQLECQAKADTNCGFVVNLPETRASDAEPQRNAAFNSLGNEYRRLHFSFVYDPETNKGDVTFVFPETSIEKGGTVSFRSFAISAME